MSWSYRTFLRPLLFAEDSEAIHDRTLRVLAWASRHELARDAAATFFGSPRMPVRAFGLTFPNPVGLAAGMDKAASAVPMWEAFGFGFSELGGVTREAQPGNDKPRMFRIEGDEALINRMGFNNPGAETVAANIRSWRSAGLWPGHPVGINLGKSKSTPLSDAPEDYAASFRELKSLADFFVINVSSPNTPGLRSLQDRAALDEILAAVQALNTSDPSPILVKIAPDLSFEAIDEILDLIRTRGISGIVATNTTMERPAADSATDPTAARVYRETGGLSGRPLTRRSTEVIRHVSRQTDGTLPIIGVGGVFNARDAWEKIAAGACLVQLYTGLVFEGPEIAADIVRGLEEVLGERGFESIEKAVGCERPGGEGAGAGGGGGGNRD